MRFSLSKTRLFALAFLLAFLSSSAPILAVQKSAFMRVHDLKAGHSKWVLAWNNPVNYVDPEGLTPIKWIPAALKTPDKWAFKNYQGTRLEICRAVYTNCFAVCLGQAPAACGTFLSPSAPTFGLCQAACIAAQAACNGGTYPKGIVLVP